MRRAENHREPSQAVWAAYWGYDSCGPGGILDRLFTALRIPQKSWGGLKRLPEVGGISYERRHSYMHLVSNFLQVSSCLATLCSSFCAMSDPMLTPVHIVGGKMLPAILLMHRAACWSEALAASAAVVM